MVDQRSQLPSFKAAITSLADQVLAVDVRAYESMPPEKLASDLEPIVSSLLASAYALVSEILRTYEAESASRDVPRGQDTLASPYVPFERAIDAAVGAQSASSVQAIGDIAFLAHLELRQRALRLERVTACRSAMAIVGECDSALRRIRKALTSIDLAFARAGFAEASLDFTSELEVSLRVRRACAKLRSRVVAGGPPTRESLCARLRAAGTAIAMMVGWEVYPMLRVGDRLALRDVQRRILDWLRQDKDPTSGLRLWEDLVGFIRMLGQVSRRQELVDHDARIVLAEHARLAEQRDEPMADVQIAALSSLEGLDEEVDLLLASGAPRDPEAWRLPLERLAAQMRSRESRAG